MSVNSPGDKPDLSVLRMDREGETYAAPRRRFPWVWVVVLLVLVVAAFAATRLPLPWLLPEVETTTVQRLTPTQASTVLTATGYTYARTRAAVGAKTIGRVTELRVDEGDRVGRGEIIAVLDSQDLEAGLRQAQAALLEVQARVADAQREAQRQQRLVEADIGPQADLDAALTRLQIAEAQVETARARIDAQRAQLDYTVIRSPISGVVIQRNVEVGEMVAPGGFTSQQSTGAIVRIADPASLEVEADINESYIARLQLGQPAAIRVDAVPDHEYTGKLRQIVPTADRQRAVVEVKVSIDDRDERLVPDMSCSVTFLEEGTDRAQLAAEPKVMVPEAALLREGANQFAFRLVDGILRKTVVQTTPGPQTGQLEVLSGLQGGETIVSPVSPELVDGERVRTAD